MHSIPIGVLVVKKQKKKASADAFLLKPSSYFRNCFAISYPILEKRSTAFVKFAIV